MTEIAVRCEPAADGWTCRVTVRERTSSTGHEVRVRREDLERLAPGAAVPDELVRAAFAFLLEREAKESILRAFDLPVIGRYFPGWEADVGRRLG
jgi:hypothetical protein